MLALGTRREGPNTEQDLGLWLWQEMRALGYLRRSAASTEGRRGRT